MDRKKASITVIGYPKILQICQEVSEEYLGSADFLYYEYDPESKGVKYIAASPDHPLGGRSRAFDRVNHDIIVVGIVTAKVMPGLDKNKVIPFRAGSKSLTQAFLKAGKIGRKAAFISPVEEKHDASFYEKVTGIEIDIYYADCLKDYRSICLAARQAGHTIVISGSYTFQIAKEYGLTPVFLFSDPDIFHDAYTRALETHRYNLSLEEKVSQLEIITQQSQDCVLFIDNFYRITFTNVVAEQKLGLEMGDISRRRVSDVFDFMTPDLLARAEHQEIMGSFKGEQVVVQAHPVVVVGRSAGTILMIKTVKDIAAMDSRVRQKMRFRGFRARYTFKDILGESSPLKHCRRIARRYAVSSAPVLIYGATGTGKELFAQAIHNSSERKRFPFVAINCATLPSELMESELFGYVKGAFTGASSQGKQGLVDQAHLGTLFLDEVDSLSPSLQAKLLRLLQEKEIIRVGGNEVIPVDIRIIAACNRNPNDPAGRTQLRQDLFYRLSILFLQLPTLSQRRSDIPLLLEHFIRTDDPGVAERLFPLHRGITDLLAGLSFEGNLRELQGIAARFVCLCDRRRLHDPFYAAELLGTCCDSSPADGCADSCLFTDTGKVDRSLGSALKAAEKMILRQAQVRCGSVPHKMAKELNIGRTTLWRKMKEHGLDISISPN